MGTSTIAGRAIKRAYNFNAGPAALPVAVLERIREELLDWHGTGMSVMEMSHRSAEFEGIASGAEAGLRKHLAIPDDYAVLFVQGGGAACNSAWRRRTSASAGSLWTCCTPAPGPQKRWAS